MKIKGYKKINKNTYTIYFVDGKIIDLYDQSIIKYELLLKKELDSKELEEIINYNNSLDAYYKALKYLSNKMRTKKEIMNYLLKNEYKEKDITNVINLLEKDGYIDEKKYITAFINDQIALTLNGPNKIKNNLKALGLEDDNVNEFLENIDNNIWLEKASKIINKKLKSNKDSKQMFKLKCERYLYDMGYIKKHYLESLENVEVSESDSILKVANNYLQKLSKKYKESDLYYQLKIKLYNKGYSSSLIDEVIDKLKKRF